MTGLGDIFFVNIEGRVDNTVGKMAIVGDEDKPPGLLVEAPDGE